MAASALNSVWRWAPPPPPPSALLRVEECLGTAAQLHLLDRWRQAPFLQRGQSRRPRRPPRSRPLQAPRGRTVPTLGWNVGNWASRACVFLCACPGGGEPGRGCNGIVSKAEQPSSTVLPSREGLVVGPASTFPILMSSKPSPALSILQHITPPVIHDTSSNSAGAKPRSANHSFPT